MVRKNSKVGCDLMLGRLPCVAMSRGRRLFLGNPIKAGFCNADPITKEGKRVQMIQMLSIPLIPLVILVVQVIVGYFATSESNQNIAVVQRSVANTQHLAKLIRALQSERMETTMYIGANKTFDIDMWNKLEAYIHNHSDAKFSHSKLQQW